MIGATEIILICAVVLLIFGGKKLPELMKGVGKGVRSFKEGMAEPSEEELQRRVKEETDRRVEAELQRRAEEGLSCTHADGETEPVNNTAHGE